MRSFRVHGLINWQAPFGEFNSALMINKYIPEDSYREILRVVGKVSGVEPHRTAFHDSFGRRVWKDVFEYTTENGTRCTDVIWAEVGY